MNKIYAKQQIKQNKEDKKQKNIIKIIFRRLQIEEDIEKIKQSISEFVKKYGIRYAIFRTTEVKFCLGEVEEAGVEAELIYQGRSQQ